MKCAIVRFKERADDAPTHWWNRGRKIQLGGAAIPYAAQDIALCEIPYMADEMAALSPKKQRKIWDKVVAALILQEVRCVYLPESLIEYGAAEVLKNDFLLPNGDAVFFAMIPAMLRKSATTRGLELTAAEVGIWQSGFDAKGHAIFAELADTVQFVTLYTNQPESAERYADAVFEQCGLSANIVGAAGDMTRCDAVILLDAPPNIALGEQIIIDASGEYRMGGINRIEFTVPFGFTAIGGYVDRFDQRTMAFLLSACDAQTAQSIGCGIGKMVYGK